MNYVKKFPKTGGQQQWTAQSELNNNKMTQMDELGKFRS